MTRYALLCLAIVFIILSGCAATTEPEVISTPQVITTPEVDFIADIRQGEAPLMVSFSVVSTGEITKWHWDFGDGQFESVEQPVHVYSSGGKYTVCLTAMGPGGSCVETKVDYIDVGDAVIGWEEAGDYIGQYKIVGGVVVGTYYAANVRGKPTFLNFHMPYDGYFTCVIWGSDRDKFIHEFHSDPETYFLNKRVLVNGLIEEYPEGSGVPEVILKNTSQIELVTE